MLYFLISTVALLLIAVTMLARANDLRWKKGLHWNTRLVGFICTGFTPIGIIGVWYLILQHPEQTNELLGWLFVFLTLFFVGLAMVFLTTPHLPPWWKWISGNEVPHPDDSEERRRTDRRDALNRQRDEAP